MSFEVDSLSEEDDVDEDDDDDEAVQAGSDFRRLVVVGGVEAAEEELDGVDLEEEGGLPRFRVGVAEARFLRVEVDTCADDDE